MNYAIEILKEKFDNRSKRMLAALKRANRSKGLDHQYYSARYIELERQVKDLEKALEVLGRESTAERTQHCKGVIKQGLTNLNQKE